jgi:acyl-CoA thioesterase-1
MKSAFEYGVTLPYGVQRLADKLRRSMLALVSTWAMAFSVVPAAAETLRLVALGDSLTQGYGLAQGEGLVPQLQDWLEMQGIDAIVINAGVSGDTTAGGLSRLDWTLADEPDAMIVALGGNDLLRGIDPANSRANLSALLTRLEAEGIPALLVGLPAPGNYGPEFQDAFNAIFPELAAQHGAALYPDLLEPITARQSAGEGIGPWMQADMIHPNAAGVAEIVAAIGPSVAELLSRLR